MNLNKRIVDSMERPKFKAHFTTRLIPPSARKEKELEFKHLTQGTQLVFEYTAKFYELEKQAYMLNKERRVNHFIKGHSGGLRTLVDNASPTSFDLALNPQAREEPQRREGQYPKVPRSHCYHFSMRVSDPKTKDQPKNQKGKGKGDPQEGKDSR